jgi:hypothetical protein
MQEGRKRIWSDSEGKHSIRGDGNCGTETLPAELKTIAEFEYIRFSVVWSLLLTNRIEYRNPLDSFKQLRIISKRPINTSCLPDFKNRVTKTA